MLEEFKNKSVKLTGVIISEPDIRRWQTNLVVRTETLELPDAAVFRPEKCRILVRLRTPRKDVFYGEKYRFSGILRVPDDKNFKDYLQQRKISAFVNVNDRRRIQYIGEERGNLLIKTALKIKKNLIGGMNEQISPVYSSLLSGMMLKAGIIPAQIREMFTKTGIVHILAISGLHVGIMCGIFLVFFRFLNIPKRISYGITFALIILYALITGCRAPVIRAGLMVNLFLLGYIIRRKTNIFIAVAFASLLILLYNPYELFSIGFQLSFITVLSIILITPKLERLFGLKPGWLVKIFVVSVAAWLGSLPLVAYHFGYISWIGPISNLVVIPLVTLILAFGFVLLICMWLPFIPYLLGAVINFLLFLLLKISEVVSSWAFVYSRIPKFDLSVVFIYYLAIFIFLFYPELKELPKRFKYVH